MSTFTSRARGYLADAARGFQRAPVEVALALFIAVTFSFAIETGDDAMLTWLETTVLALLALAAAWTGTLLHALGVWRARTRWAVTLAGALVVALYGWLVIDFERAAEGWRAAGLVGAAALWLIGLPAFGAGTDAVARLRRVDGRVLLRLLAVLLYAAALFTGLALALAAVDTLFELNLEGEIYGHVFGWIHFVLVPWVVLGGLDDYVRPAAGPEAVASAVHRLTIYLVPPLLAIYFVILYAYVVRIAITGEVPKNLVSPLVLAAGALTALALLLFDPPPGRAGLARALRLAPPLLLPLAPLGVWALTLRIDQYGWTEFRALRLVLLAAFTALAAAGTVQLWRRRAFALHVIPAALAIAMLLAVVGPWGVLPFARRSQQVRLRTALAAVAKVPPDTAPPAGAALEPLPAGGATRPDSTITFRTVPAELYDRIQTDARYVHSHFGVGALPPELKRIARASRRESPLFQPLPDYAAELGLRRSATARGGDEYVHRRLPQDIPVAAGGRTLYRIDYSGEQRPRPASLATADSLRLIMHLGRDILYADLAPVIAAAAVQGKDPGELPAGAGVVGVFDPRGGARGELVVLDLTSRVVQGRRTLQHVSGILLLPDTLPH